LIVKLCGNRDEHSVEVVFLKALSKGRKDRQALDSLRDKGSTLL
jgi:hypothetical protein